MDAFACRTDRTRVRPTVCGLLAVCLACAAAAEDAPTAAAVPGSADSANTAQQAAEPAPATEAEIAYFFGFSFGNMLRQGGTKSIDFEALQRGMNDSLTGQVPDLVEARQQQIIFTIQERQAAAQRNTAERMIAEAQQFMTAHALEPGVVVTPSGLHYEVIREGSGARPGPQDRVVVHYNGTLTSGRVFDSTIDRGEPAEFGLGQVIAGWGEGLQLMRVGGKMRFTIPPDLGYGPGGTGNIPPHAVLIFEIELLEVKPPVSSVRPPS